MRKIAKKKTNEEFTIQVYELVGNDYEFLEDYINAKTKISTIHHRCGHKYQVTPDDFLNGGNRCPVCQPNRKKSHADYVKDIKEAHCDEFTVMSEYTTSKSKVLIRHNVCGEINNVEATSALLYGGCKRCGTERRSGSKHYKYNPNLSEEDRVRRENQRGDIMRWVKQVFEHGDYTCQKCDVRGKELNAHHIDSWDIHPNERFEVNNGATLCVDCHKEFHMEYGYGNNYRHQYIEFITN